MARKNAIVSVDIAADLETVRFNVEGCQTIILDLNGLAADVLNRAKMHGLVQKISDAAALGKDATPADKHAAMSAVVSRLLEGDWNKRSGEGSDSAPSGIIFRAFYEFAKNRAASAKKPVPDETAVRALYDSKSRAEQLAIRKIPEVAKIIERIKSERGGNGTKVDGDALLADLGL